MPDLHFLVEFARVDHLVDLEVLEGKEVHMRDHPTSMHLLLVEFPQVGNGRKAFEAAGR